MNVLERIVEPLISARFNFQQVQLVSSLFTL